MGSTFLSAPIGLLSITSDGKAITAVKQVRKKGQENPDALTERCARELEEYFAGRPTRFTVPVDPCGTPFQRSVWKKLQGINYGKTASYSSLARALKNPKASRAIGGACGKNPLLILIPCHRVIASDGSMGGFSAGIRNKQWLHSLEKGSS